jgi:hypothetical protein
VIVAGTVGFFVDVGLLVLVNPVTVLDVLVAVPFTAVGPVVVVVVEFIVVLTFTLLSLSRV